jgi:hypothetical protein
MWQESEGDRTVQFDRPFSVREGIAHVVDDDGYTRVIPRVGHGGQPEQQAAGGGRQVSGDCRETPGGARPGVAPLLRRTDCQWSL